MKRLKRALPRPKKAASPRDDRGSCKSASFTDSTSERRPRPPYRDVSNLQPEFIFPKYQSIERGYKVRTIYDMNSPCTSGKPHNPGKLRWTRYELGHRKIAKSYQIQSMRSHLELQACKIAIPRFRFHRICACRNIDTRRGLASQCRPFSPPYQAMINNARPSLERSCRQSCSTQDIEFPEEIFCVPTKKQTKKNKKESLDGQTENRFALRLTPNSRNSHC